MHEQDSYQVFTGCWIQGRGCWWQGVWVRGQKQVHPMKTHIQTRWLPQGLGSLVFAPAPFSLSPLHPTPFLLMAQKHTNSKDGVRHIESSSPWWSLLLSGCLWVQRLTSSVAAWWAEFSEACKDHLRGAGHWYALGESCWYFCIPQQSLSIFWGSICGFLFTFFTLPKINVTDDEDEDDDDDDDDFDECGRKASTKISSKENNNWYSCLKCTKINQNGKDSKPSTPRSKGQESFRKQEKLLKHWKDFVL